MWEGAKKDGNIIDRGILMNTDRTMTFYLHNMSLKCGKMTQNQLIKCLARVGMHMKNLLLVQLLILIRY